MINTNRLSQNKDEQSREQEELGFEREMTFKMFEKRENQQWLWKLEYKVGMLRLIWVAKNTGVSGQYSKMRVLLKSVDALLSTWVARPCWYLELCKGVK